jgi:hypothetical protein
MIGLSMRGATQGGVLAVLLLSLFALPARAAEPVVPPAKFEPPAGKIYSGASSSVEAIVQLSNALGPQRKPMLVGAYDSLHDLETSAPVYGVLNAHNLFPGAKLAIGLQLPVNPLTTNGQPVYPESARNLRRIGEGGYDETIRRLARTYRDLGQDIFLRIGYEFDGPWNNYDPAAYRAAFRRIVELFRDEGASNVAFVWNSWTPSCQTDASLPLDQQHDCRNQMRWYPGDEYVDWFSVNVWTKGFVPPNAPTNNPQGDISAFLRFAAAHGKPVLLDEASYSKHNDGGYRWQEWHAAYFTSLRESGVKGFQYVNWNWPVYPRDQGWTNWADAKVSPPHELRTTGDTPVTQRVALYDEELARDVYVHRGAEFYNPVPLWIKPTRNVPEASERGTSAVDGQPVQRTNDVYSALPGYGYDPGNARHYYGDGWSTYWGDPRGTAALSFSLTLPAGTAGYLDIEAHAYEASIGNKGAAVPSVESLFPPRTAEGVQLAMNKATRVPAPPLPRRIQLGDQPASPFMVSEGPMKLRFTAADTANGTLQVRVTGVPGAQLRVLHVGLQTVSPESPAAPAELQLTTQPSGTLALGWRAVPGAELYNIYRDGRLVATAPTASYELPAPTRAASYQVSAWHGTQGEGELSPPVRWTPAPADLDGDGHSDRVILGPGGVVLARTSTAPNELSLIANGQEYGVGARLYLADVSGDRRADLVWHAADGRVFLQRSTPAGLEAAVSVERAAVPPGANLLLSDVDSDGRADLVWWTAGGAVLLQQAAGNGFAAPVALDGPAPPGERRLLVPGDLDGDGRAELVSVMADGRLVRQTVTGTSLDPPVQIGALDHLPTEDQLRLADTDGDGRADLLWLAPDGRAFIARSTANGLAGLVELPAGGVPLAGRTVHLGEFDGDGRLDLLWWIADGRFLTQRNQGGSFGQATEIPPHDGLRPGVRLCLPACATPAGVFAPVLFS